MPGRTPSPEAPESPDETRQEQAASRGHQTHPGHQKQTQQSGQPALRSEGDADESSPAHRHSIPATRPYKSNNHSPLDESSYISFDEFFDSPQSSRSSSPPNRPISPPFPFEMPNHWQELKATIWDFYPGPTAEGTSNLAKSPDYERFDTPYPSRSPSPPPSQSNTLSDRATIPATPPEQAVENPSNPERGDGAEDSSSSS